MGLYESVIYSTRQKTDCRLHTKLTYAPIDNTLLFMKQNKDKKHSRLALPITHLLVLIAAFVFLQAGLVIADDIPPEEVEIVTPVYAPEPGFFEPQFGKYTYSVSWQGIPAGTLEMNLERQENYYRVRASARTNRFVSMFYKLRFNTEALVSSTTLHPKTSVYTNRQNDRRENTKIDFLPDGGIHSVHEDRRGRKNELRFEPNNFTLDPFSAVFLALSLKWEVGDTRQFDTFTGKGRYLIELTAIEQTSIQVQGAWREAIVISPRVRNLTDTDSFDDDDRLQEARIYVSTEPSREILRISSDIFVGTINTRMVSFAPSENHSRNETAVSGPPEGAPAPDIQPVSPIASRTLFPTGSKPGKRYVLPR